MLPFEFIPPTPTPTPTPFNPIGHFIPTRTPTPLPDVSAATIAQVTVDNNLALALCVAVLAIIIIFIVWGFYVNSHRNS